MSQKFTLTILAFLCLITVTTPHLGCKNQDDTSTVTAVYSKPAGDFAGKYAQDWMSLAYKLVKEQGYFANQSSRLYAYTGVTVYESVVNGIPNGRSLSGQVNGGLVVPKIDSNKEYDWGIVICQATALVMPEMLPNIKAASRQQITELAQAEERSLIAERSVNATVVENSKTFGKALAQSIVDWAAKDNYAATRGLLYRAPARAEKTSYFDPSYWSEYGVSAVQAPFEPYWFSLRPFVVSGAEVTCAVEAPPEFSTDKESTFYKEAKEVYDIAQSGDKEKLDIARYWANNPGQSGTPAGHWISIANQLVDQQKMNLAKSAQMYAYLGMGTADAFIASWYLKYKHYLLRPITYIRENIEPNWGSPVTTPPYPDYTSGTSTAAGVNSYLLTKLFDDNTPFTDRTHLDKGYGQRVYTSFKKAGTEAYLSRLYAGVHYRRPCELGFKQGECIGEQLFNKIKFTNK
jgi:type II secretory pathway pseudopilin PulG